MEGEGYMQGGFDGQQPAYPAGGAGEVRPGDWSCPTCGANVFASKNSCFRCQTPKPGMGGDAQQGMFRGGGGGGGVGGGDVRPGDWTCPGCGANVFASKNSCFRCQSPKPDDGGYKKDDGYGGPAPGGY